MLNFKIFFTIIPAVIHGYQAVMSSQGTEKITTNSSRHIVRALDSPALRIEVHMNVTFPKEKCCPVVVLIDYEHREREYQERYFGGRNCYLNRFVPDMFLWYRKTFFVLPNNTADKRPCPLKRGHYHCNLTFEKLNYEPKVWSLIFTYPCGQEKSLHGFEYSYTVSARNTTTCQAIQKAKGYNNTHFVCSKFYKFVAFPNPFGHDSQAEAFPVKQIFEDNLYDRDPCHKHLAYAICQGILPRCPDFGNTNEVSHLIPICQKMCWEIIGVCRVALGAFFSMVDCN